MQVYLYSIYLSIYLYVMLRSAILLECVCVCLCNNTYNSRYNSIVFWDINIIEMDSYSFIHGFVCVLYVNRNGFMPNSAMFFRLYVCFAVRFIFYYSSDVCLVLLQKFQFCMVSSAISTARSPFSCQFGLDREGGWFDGGVADGV